MNHKKGRARVDPSTPLPGGQAALSCKLEARELRERKATVIASLRRQMTGRRELKRGFVYHFGGSDESIGELTEFIKTERRCCGFFTFDLRVRGEGSDVELRITGPQGAKEFLTSELNLDAGPC